MYVFKNYHSRCQIIDSVLKSFKLFDSLQVFAKMGMTELFDENKDLGDFAENMSLNFDDFIHKAVIEVDEEGTTAAAATLAPSVLSMPAEPINFHADHPFVFMINDHITEEVLFTGIYRGPTD